MNARAQRNDERLRQFNLNLYAGIAVYNSSTHVINLHVFYVDFLLIDQWKLKKKGNGRAGGSQFSKCLIFLLFAFRLIGSNYCAPIATAYLSVTRFFSLR